ncbi:MAG: transketolase C-terminal domain-containing protein [Caldilineaceae bacterium]
MVVRALEAAAILAEEGISVEVVDPRTLKPLDEVPSCSRWSRPERVLIVHEAVRTGGYGGELAAVIAESEAFDYLDAPIKRLAGLDIPVPYNRDLERQMVPQVDDIVGGAQHGSIWRIPRPRAVRMCWSGGRWPAVIMPKFGMAQEEGTILLAQGRGRPRTQKATSFSK